MKSNLDTLLAVAALAAVALALWHLQAADDALRVERLRLGTTPVTIYRGAEAPPGPVVLIAHGFAGSQQLMAPLAVSLARNGYLAVTYDLLGHGRNPVPLSGDLHRVEGATAKLLEEMNTVARHALLHEGSDRRIAVLGHSMAADLVVRFAIEQPNVSATVAISMASPAVNAEQPRNLLVLSGGLETGLRAEALRVVALAAPDETVEAGRTYGDPTQGNARRAAVAEGVEHLGVLYSEQSLGETVDWLNATFGRGPRAWLDARGGNLLLLFAALVVLFRPLTQLLPRVSRRPLGASLDWMTLISLCIGPALLTPLLLRVLPTDLLPILLLDYLALHFFAYGLFTWAGLRMHARERRQRSIGASEVSAFALVLATVAMASYVVVVMGSALDTYVTSFVPVPARLPLMALLLVGGLVYFGADEWMIRGEHARRGAYALTKLSFCLSLGLAIMLDPEQLFFLVMVLPVVIILFIVHGLLSGWMYRRCQHPAVAAVASAITFAWAIGVTLPLISAT